jgi:arylsulfatase A-like enzyme
MNQCHLQPFVARGCSRWANFAVILLLVGLVAAWADGLNGAESEHPNIVLMLVDDMGVMDSSVPFLVNALGEPQSYPLNDRYVTPNMERLAANGIRFSQFYAMSVCSPSRLSLMTGQNSARHRTTNWIHPDADNAGPNGPPGWNWKGLTATDITLPRLLQQHGYRTIHVGKGHFGPRRSEGEDPTRLGFDVNVGGSSIGQPGSYYGMKHFGALQPKPSHAVPGLEAYHGTEIFLTDALTAEAKRHVSAAVESGKPFFLSYSHYAVHAPFDADDRFMSNPKVQDWPRPAQAFASLIQGMDRSIGELQQHLESLGVAEQTLFLFLGDNGSDAPLGGPHEVACAAPLRGKKGSHYEGGMRVPMIAAWSRPNPDSELQKRLPISPGRTQTCVAAIYDWFPTLLEFVRIPVPRTHTIDGRSLRGVLTGAADSSRSDRFLMHYPHAPHRSNHFTVFRDGDWKLIYHYFPSADSDGSHYQLFRLSVDPFEQSDLALREPQQLQRMVQSMIECLREQNALYPMDHQGLDVLPIEPK